MTHMALGYHAGSDDEVKIYTVQDGTATVTVETGELFELPYGDITNVIVNGEVIDAFEGMVNSLGQRVAEDAVELLTGTRSWMLDVLIAWSHCYR
jgi:hypothetical protein